MRHVFKHFGSGTLKGVPTYLSKHFILNPILFREEWEGLVKKKGVTPKVIVHPEAIITTPYDMIINQIVETYRGKNRHGRFRSGWPDSQTYCGRQKVKSRAAALSERRWNSPEGNR